MTVSPVRKLAPGVAVLFLAARGPAVGGESVPNVWERESAKVNEALAAHDWTAAERKAHDLGRKLMDSMQENQAAPKALAAVMAWRALACAGKGQTEDAEFFWFSAYALNPEIVKLDLSVYSETWARLRALRPDPTRECLGKMDPRIDPPQITLKANPIFPYNRSGNGTVIVCSVLGATGRLREPIVPGEDSASAAMRYSALDALVRWRYKPATLVGEPVDVIHVIKVDFKRR